MDTLMEQPISLHVSGSGMLLQGRFDHWVPVALATDNGGMGTVRFVFDATATATGKVGPLGNAGGAAKARVRTKARAGNLFSFSASAVRAIGPQMFVAKGTLSADGARRGVEVMIQAPDGHTPFFFFTLPVDRARFPWLWRHLEERSAQAPGDGEMRARAWVRVPDIASA